MMNTATVTSTPKEKFKSYKRARLISKILAYTLLVILAVVWIYPLLWLVICSFATGTNGAPTMFLGNYFPSSKEVWSFNNYKYLFTSGFGNGVNTYANLNGSGTWTDSYNFPFYFLKWFGNTLFVATISCIISTAFTLMVAYVMSKLKFGFRKTYLNIAMIIGLFPGFMSMIAIYYMLKFVGLAGNLWALIICNCAGAGTGFYVAKGFFDVVPNALIESARLDGATNAQIFVHIILPMSKPIIIYQALMAFTGPWMDFIFAKVIMGETNPENWTVSVGLYSVMYNDKLSASLFSVAAAGCVCVAIPIVTLFMFLQQYYVEGVTAGSVK
jgi:arabinogalactan oligomer/maltooligosaccharide transport system permease protein